MRISQLQHFPVRQRFSSAAYDTVRGAIIVGDAVFGTLTSSNGFIEGALLSHSDFSANLEGTLTESGGLEVGYFLALDGVFFNYDGTVADFVFAEVNGKGSSTEGMYSTFGYMIADRIKCWEKS